MGIIGLGCRGIGLIKNAILPNDKAQITVVCDVYQDRVDKAAELVERIAGNTPEKHLDYHDVLASRNIDAVLIATSWQTHIPIAIEAVNAGLAVALEVGNAYSIEQCWDLVKAWEKNKTPFMFMENCCYGRRELLAKNMTEIGVFGDIMHCSGGYHHDLRKEVTFGYDNRHYRIDNYLLRNCENYPTHELGPIAKILNINHGNRMLTLSSTASASGGMHQYILDRKPNDENIINRKFNQ